MRNTFLYVVTVLIWGSTWLAIEYQLGDIAVEVSLVYRFALAAFIILGISWVRGLSLSFSMKEHGYFILLGALNFGLNYAALYTAQKYLTSAMTSIGFSMLLLVNIVNTRIFFGKPIATRTYLGALVGIGGILVLFAPELMNEDLKQASLSGLIFIALGVLAASLGNMVSVRNSNRGLPIFQSSGWAMLYGTLLLVAIAHWRGHEFNISTRPEYLASLLYLSVFGTVIAFYSYFYLLKNIGPEKASYSIVLFPVVAVILSSIFEGFEWNYYTLCGFLLVASGNLIVLVPKGAVSRLRVKRMLPARSIDAMNASVGRETVAQVKNCNPLSKPSC